MRARTIVTASALGVAGVGFWYHIYTTRINTGTVNSSLFKAIMFNLRRSEIVKSELGDKVRYDDKKFVDGEVNAIKGTATLRFDIVGDQGRGKINYQGTRINEGNQWQSKLFNLEANGKIISLKDSEE